MTFIPLSQLFSLRRSADAPVGTSGGREIDFATFSMHVAWNAAALRQLGCSRGLLIAQDSYWGAVGLMALQHAGATPIFPQSTQAPDPRAYGADCIVGDAEILSPGEPAARSHRLQAGEVTPTKLGALDPVAAKLELYTAGSTGEAKCVIKPLADMEAEALEINAAFGASLAPANVLGTVPFHHLYGLTFRLVWPLCAGWRIVGQTYRYWEEIARESTSATVLVTSPAHLTRLPDLEFAAARRPQMVLSAGAPLSDQAARGAVSILGTPVTDIFGSTETGVIAYRTRNSKETPWRPFPGVKIQQRDDGRLAVRSPYISQETKASWFETADMIVTAANGGFELQGRADQIVKIEGNRVSLPEIETSLNALPMVEAAAVVPLEVGTGVLGAAVALTPEGWRVHREIGSFRLGQRLRRELAQQHEPTGLPKRWRFIERLPEAVLGKRKKTEIASLFIDMDAPTEPDVRAVRSVTDGTELDLFISEALLPLRGHFPGLPVVPGVALINWVVRYARLHLSAPDDAGRAFQIKFRKVITPPALITLALSRQPELNRIKFEYRQGDTTLSVGALKLQAKRRQ